MICYDALQRFMRENDMSRAFAAVAVLMLGVAADAPAQTAAPGLDNAFHEAYSATSLTQARKESSTKEVADRMAKHAATTVPQTPLTTEAGETAIGAIGISGARGGRLDEECARVALAKIKDRMK
jgi:uncharacterized protein GlcG (DUF336 family)